MCGLARNESYAVSGVKLIVGLGNPGGKYQTTRHNAGFWFVDQIARAAGGVFRPEPKFHGDVCTIKVGGDELRLLKPTTFMNRSGQAVASLAQYFKIEPAEVLVAHDELDFAPGKVRLKQGGGHGGHNGLRDIVAQLGTGDFLRLRIGIGHPGASDLVTGYVLGPPGLDDRISIDRALDAAAGVVPMVVAGDLMQAMQRLHAQ